MGGRGSKTAAPQGIELVQAAMAAGCPPDAGDAEGNSALGAACFSGSHEVVEMMLAAQADIEHRNAIGTTPLWCFPPSLCAHYHTCAQVSQI